VGGIKNRRGRKKRMGGKKENETEKQMSGVDLGYISRTERMDLEYFGSGPSSGSSTRKVGGRGKGGGERAANS